MNKLLLVAKREYVATVRRPGFLIATFGLPLFLLLLFSFIGVIGFYAAWTAETSQGGIGVVDRAGLLRPELKEPVREASKGGGAEEVLRELPPFLSERIRGRIMIMAESEDLKVIPSRDAALRDESLDAFYVIGDDFLETGNVELVKRKSGLFEDSYPGWRVLERWLRASLVSGNLEESAARRIWLPLNLRSRTLGEAGEAEEASDPLGELKSFIVPYLFTIIFFMAIMGSSGYLLQGVAEEKENRVIEILLSSVTTDQLLAGKVLGQCGAGLTQIAVWGLIAFLPAISLLPFLEFNPVQFIAAPIFFILGFLLFGTLMGAFGSLGNNQKESQQWAVVWTLLAVSPFFALTIIMQEPNGFLARLFSFIPFTAPLTVILRTSVTEVPLWEIAASAGVLALSVLLGVRLSAKLFRVGVLLYGKRPSIREVLRWVRAA